MKKTLILPLLAIGAMSASAQAIYQQPSFGDNWSFGVDGGVTTPLTNAPFFKSMRGMFGANLSKQITPVFGLGVEGQAMVNTSSWGEHSSTAIDGTYVGAYGTVDLMNLFGGYQCETRPFTIAAVAGAGWGHEYYPKDVREDWNYFATKLGLNFNFNVSPSVTITVQPSVVYDMSDSHAQQSSASYDARNATFNVTGGVTYHFGGTNFNCVAPFDPALAESLNMQINDLRAQLADANAAAQQWQSNAVRLKNELDACNNRPAETVVETVVDVNNYLNTVRYVFFKIGSSVITPDQMPNVEMIAAYLKNHPEASVQVKGYASQDGNEEFNIKLAQNRAESVKNALINKYKIPASRIQAEGQGIGHMFQEESWNRVSICIINDTAD